MKLLHRNVERDGSGSMGLIAEEMEDMWHAYNLIAVGDTVKSTTIRRVQTESATGSVDSQRVRCDVALKVHGLDFDSAAGVLRVKGRVIEENPFMKMGAHHTLELEQNRKFTITKDLWDSVALGRVAEATDPGARADVAAVVMQEGLANVCLLTAHMTVLRARIDMPLPRKGRGSTTQHDKAKIRFFDAVLQAILRAVNFGLVKSVILASPGFVVDEFYDYMFKDAVKRDDKILFENKGKFVKAHCSSGHKHALKEVLADSTVMAKLADTKAASDTRALDDFYKMMKEDSDRAYYGYNHVLRANDACAIDTLLVTDELFRSTKLDERKKYVDLVDRVRDQNGNVRIFSSLHVSGEQLGLLSGVAALLRFPLPDLDDEDGESQSSDESDDDSNSASE